MKFFFLIMSIILIFTGCDKNEGEVYIAPQPSGMEDAIYSAAGVMAVTVSDPAAIPEHWDVPKILINSKPSPEEIKKAIATQQPEALAELLRKNKKRFLLVERNAVKNLGRFGHNIANAAKLKGFSYYGIDAEFVLITIEHEKPKISAKGLDELFAFTRTCLKNEGKIEMKAAGEELNKKFYTELSLTLFEGGRRENWQQKKGDSPATAAYKLCNKFIDRHEKNADKYPINPDAPMTLDFFFGHANFEDPTDDLFDENITPGEFGISIKRYVPLKDGRYEKGFYYFMLPMVFNLREIKEPHKLAQKLCKELSGEKRCYEERANIMKRFETLTYLQRKPGGEALLLKRGRFPNKTPLTKESVSAALEGLLEASMRFIEADGGATRYIDMMGEKSPKKLPPGRLAHFYAPLVRAAAIFGKGWPEKIEKKIALLPEESRIKIADIVASYKPESRKFKLYTEKTAPSIDLIGGIKGDKHRGVGSFSPTRYWHWARQYKAHRPPHVKLKAAAKFILYWITTPDSVGFRLPEHSMKMLNGCIARSPTVLLSNPQDQSAAAYTLALWLENTQNEIVK